MGAARKPRASKCVGDAETDPVVVSKLSEEGIGPPTEHVAADDDRHRVDSLPGNLGLQHEISLLQIHIGLEVRPNELGVLPDVVDDKGVPEWMKTRIDFLLVERAWLPRFGVESVLDDDGETLADREPRECTVHSPRESKVGIVDPENPGVKVRREGIGGLAAETPSGDHRRDVPTDNVDPLVDRDERDGRRAGDGIKAAALPLDDRGDP